MQICGSKILEIWTENRTNQLNTTIKSTEQIADLHKLLKLYQHSRPQLKKLQEWNETTSSWGNVLGSELCLKLRFPFFDDSLFDPEPTIFFNNFGNHQNRIWKKPCKFEQEMLSHKGNPATVCTWRYFSRSAHQTISWYDRSVASEMGARGGSGVTCWPVRGGIREPVVVGRSRCEELFWEARWRRRGSYQPKQGEEERVLLMFQSLS